MDAQTIFDIEMTLPVQADYTIPVVVGTLLSLIVLWALYAYHRSRTRRFKALQALKHLARSLQAESLSNKNCAYEIAAQIQYALNFTQVSNNTPFPESLTRHHQRWHAFLRLLDKARYAPAAVSNTSLNQLLHEAEFWLRRWP